MEQTRGIVLIAAGKTNYGYMAANLALSIKCNCDVKITIFHDGKALTRLNQQWLSLFDQIIEMPKNCYQVNGFDEPIKSKLHLYDLSPYDTTIFLDADMVCPRFTDFNKLFDELDGEDFTMQNRGYKDINEVFPENYCFWMNIEDAKKVYNFTSGKYYRLASEFIYFKKTERINKLFDDAKLAYEKPLINFIKFSGGFADEAMFSISMLINNIYPHKDNFSPIYWEQEEKQRLRGNSLNGLRYGYSLGGSSSSDLEKKNYNDYVQFYCNQMGFENQYQAKSKAEFNPDRQLI